MFESIFRGAHYKLQNAIGKRRDLYRKPPQTEVHGRDIRRWQKLETETQRQLVQTKHGLSALANATANQLHIDQLWDDFGQLYGEAKKQRTIAGFNRRLTLSAVNLEIEGARYEMLALLEADAAREEQMRLAYLAKKGLLAGNELNEEMEEEDS